MIRTTFVILSLTLGASSAASAQNAEKYQKISTMYVTQAIEALNTGDASGAQAFYEKALVANPANVMALVGLGDAHSVQGRTGRGLKYYRFALEVVPNNKPALERQALAFLKKGNIDRAVSNQMILERLCSNGCEALSLVNLAIADFHAHPPAEKMLEDAPEDDAEG